MTTKITEKNISNIANAAVQWQSVVVADGSTGLTTVAGRGYFINTTSGAQTVTLPASVNVGDVIVLKDYARTWGTNAVSIASNTFDGVGSRTPSFSTNGQTVTLVYMDNTQGWSLINEDTTTGLGAVFISATGGTITTSGNFKIHSFTGDGCFVVSTVGNPAGGGSNVDYLVVAGGGGAGGDRAAGGGGGGFRESKDSTINSPHTASPLAATSGITLTAQTYPITVGAGGAGDNYGASPSTNNATIGSSSVFSTITSTGGGYGASALGASGENGGAGGSGGGGASSGNTGGAGNTPPTSPSQGNPGGSSSTPTGGGGGGATASGSPTPASDGGAGGAGATTSISGSSTAYSGGGGGGAQSPGNGGAGGTGGGAAGSPPSSTPAASRAGSVNTGGGGGGGNQTDATGQPGGAGGSGIVIIRYKFQ